MWAIGSNLGATVEMGAQRHRGYLATGGTEGYTRGVEGPGIEGYTTGYRGPGIAGCTTGQRGIRSAPSLPARFLNTSTLQLETLQHTLKKNHQSHILQFSTKHE